MRNTKLILLLLAALLIGMCAGFYINSAIIRAAFAPITSPGQHTSQHHRPPSKRLDLTLSSVRKSSPPCKLLPHGRNPREAAPCSTS